MPKGIYPHSSPSTTTLQRRAKTMQKRYGGSWNKGHTAKTDERVKKYAESQKGRLISQETRAKISVRTKESLARPEIKAKLRANRLGKKTPLKTRIKQSEALKGDKSHLWRGGLKALNNSYRQTLEYKLWREAVFERDSYTCVECGDKRGGNLNADHIKPFALFPELRTAIDNGKTLCISCHRLTESYGRRSFTREHYDKQG